MSQSKSDCYFVHQMISGRKMDAKMVTIKFMLSSLQEDLEICSSYSSENKP